VIGAIAEKLDVASSLIGAAGLREARIPLLVIPVVKLDPASAPENSTSSDTDSRFSVKPLNP